MAANMCAFFKHGVSFCKAGFKRATPGALVALAFFFGQFSQAEELSLVPLPPSSAQPGWTGAGTEAELGQVATINVPDGCRFAGVQAASLYLQRMGSPAPRNLLGVLVADSGKWYAVLQFSNLGYVKDVSEQQMDAAAILSVIQNQVAQQNTQRSGQGLPALGPVSWARPPSYDAATHAFDWAIRVESDSNGVINHNARLLGRRGVLDVTIVQPADQDSAEVVPLHQIVKNIAFNPGERYSDYQSGDKLAKISLTDLVAGNDKQGQPTGALAQNAVWIGAGCFALVVAGGGTWIWRRRRHSLRRSEVAARSTNGFGYTKSAFKLHRLKPAAQVAGNGLHKHTALRKRRMFDYHKFYSDMILQVSSGPTTLPPAAARPVPLRGATAAQPKVDEATSQAIVSAHEQLIANQKSLIEEQRRLLQEQSRLIEEKSRLIHEKTQLLEKQRELFERDIL